MTRKRSLIHFMSMVLALFLLLIACGQPTIPAENTPEEDAPAESETAVEEVSGDDEAMDGPVTLNVLVGHWTVGADESPFDRAKAELEARHPNVEVVFDVQQGGGNVRSKFLSSTAAGEAPDVAMVDSMAIGEMATAGLLADLTPFADQWDQWDDLLPGFVDAGSWEGVPYGVFMNTDMRVLVYNKQLFEAAGLDPNQPPTTWDELFEYSEALNDPPNVYAMQFPGASEEQLSMRWYMFLRGAGGDILDENGCAAFNSTAGVDAANLYKQLIDDGYTPIDVLSTSANDNDKALAGGTYAMGIVGSWFFNFAKEAGIDTVEAFNETFGVAPVPSPDGSGSPSSAGGWTVALPEGSQNKELAWEFITIAMNQVNHRDWALARGYVPVRSSLASEAGQFSEVIPFFPTLQEMLPDARTRPAVPEYNQMSAEVQAALQAVMLGEMDAQEALNQAAENANELLSSCGEGVSSTGESMDELMADDEPVTLNVLVGHWTVGADESMFDRAKAEIEARHPNVEVVFDVQQGGGNVRSKFLSSTAAGEAPDVAMVDSMAIGEMVEAGLLTDLTSFSTDWDQWDDILPGFRDAGSWEGIPYGIFMNTDMRVLVYNKRLFEEAGLDPNQPPTTWDELLEFSEVLNNPPAVYAMQFPGASEEQLSMRWYMFLRGAGGDILDSDGCAAFNSSAGVEAANLYKQMIEDGYTPIDVLSTSANDNDKALAGGTYAMGIVGSWFFNFAKEAGIDTVEAFNETFGVAAVPSPDGSASPPSAGGWTVALPEGSEHKELAWEFITIAMNQANHRDWALARGYVPVRASLTGDPEFNDVIPFFDTLEDLLPIAQTRPAIPQYGQLSAEVQMALQAVMLGEADAQEALDAAAGNVNDILGCS
ncbi:MAG: ABC transporter substrate-binding protein [Chloroflexota bacterium]